MTHIPSVRETFAYLGQTVGECSVKLKGFDTQFRLLSDGVQISVSSGGLTNHHFVSWDELAEAPGLLPLRAGVASGELVRLKDLRAGWRADLAAQGSSLA